MKIFGNDLSKMKTAELDETLDLYKAAGIEIPELSKNDEKKAFIEEKAKSEGVPHKVTAEDCADPEKKDVFAANEIVEGDVILIPLEEVEEGAGDNKDVKIEYPEVGGNGKFQAVEVKGGFVVYNPNGQRASGVITDTEAKDMVLRNNVAMGLK